MSVVNTCRIAGVSGAPTPQEGKESHGTEGGAEGESGRYKAITRSCRTALDCLPSHMRVVEEANGVDMAKQGLLWKTTVGYICWTERRKSYGQCLSCGTTQAQKVVLGHLTLTERRLSQIPVESRVSRVCTKSSG